MARDIEIHVIRCHCSLNKLPVFVFSLSYPSLYFVMCRVSAVCEWRDGRRFLLIRPHIIMTIQACFCRKINTANHGAPHCIRQTWHVSVYIYESESALLSNYPHCLKLHYPHYHSMRGLVYCLLKEANNINPDLRLVRGHKLEDYLSSVICNHC